MKAASRRAYKSCREEKTKPAEWAGFFPSASALATARAIHATVMIEIVLTIMLLLVDTAAFDILRFVQAGALATGHHTIGLGASFHVLDMLLATLHAVRFALRQSAGGHPLLDTLLLVGLTLIDARGIGLGKNSGRQKKGKYGDSLQMLLHDFLLFVANCLAAITRQMA